MTEHPSQFKPVRTLPRATVGSTRRRRRYPAPPEQVSPPVKPPEQPQPVEHSDTEAEAPEQTYWAWMWVAACGVAAGAYILGLL